MRWLKLFGMGCGPTAREDADARPSGARAAVDMTTAPHNVPHFPRQTGSSNHTRFSMVFSQQGRASTSSRLSGQRLSVDMIRAPMVRENSAFMAIREPGTDEMNPEIEAITVGSIGRNNCNTAIDWEGYAGRDRTFESDIQTLKHTLGQIDQRVADGINEMRRTAYDNIRQAKKQPTPDYAAQAKQLTKKRPKELFAFNEKRRDMRESRLRVRESLVRKLEVEDDVVGQAIGRFKKRITEELEPGRRKDIRNACVAFLQNHEHLEADRREFLIALVGEISPDASSEFRQTIASRASGVHAAASEVAMLLAADLTDAQMQFLLGQPLSRLKNI
jgi:hypothetical protein